MSFSTEQFLEYNKNNIYANLLQVEDHISSTIRCDSCVNKHLTTAWGEALEAAKSHCDTPETCNTFDNLAKKIYELMGKERQEGAAAIQSEVKSIRKYFENELLNYDGCKDGSCTINFSENCYLDENFNQICEKYNLK